jgi:hypothetical protein
MRGGVRGPGESMNRGPGSRDDLPTLRVTNITEDAQEQDLRDLFGTFGRVARVYVGRDRETGIGKGFAFISYEDKTHAQRAMEKMHGRGYDSLILNVQWSRMCLLFARPAAADVCPQSRGSSGRLARAARHCMLWRPGRCPRCCTLRCVSVLWAIGCDTFERSWWDARYAPGVGVRLFIPQRLVDHVSSFRSDLLRGHSVVLSVQRACAESSRFPQSRPEVELPKLFTDTPYPTLHVGPQEAPTGWPSLRRGPSLLLNEMSLLVLYP